MRPRKESLKDASDLGRTDWTADVAAARREGRPIALLFDYDGTLTPIVHHPSLARLSVQTRRLLAALGDVPGVSVGVISGRPLEEVRALVGLPGLFYAGSGGLEMDLNGERLTFRGDAAFRAAMNGLSGPLVRIVAGYPGAWIEHKEAACSLHFRNVTALRALAFQHEVRSLLDPCPAIRHRVISQAIEVIPSTGWDRGTAVAALLAQLDHGALPVYAGHATCDAEAMAVAACLGGVAIGVGADAPSLATHRIRNAADLVAGLERLLARLSPFPPSPCPADFGSTNAPGGVASGSPKGPGLLVVDADPQARSESIACLRAQGWQVWEAAEAEEALALSHRLKGRLKAALVDLQMPGLEGWRALVELGATIPSLVRGATTIAVGGQAEEAFRQTSDLPLFVKPLQARTVSAELLRLMGEDDLQGS